MSPLAYVYRCYKRTYGRPRTVVSSASVAVQIVVLAALCVASTLKHASAAPTLSVLLVMSSCVGFRSICKTDLFDVGRFLPSY